MSSKTSLQKYNPNSTLSLVFSDYFNVMGMIPYDQYFDANDFEVNEK